MKVEKEYPRAFLLEPTKLTRIVDKIHERLGDHQCTTTRDHFEVFLSGNQHVELANVDAVLALENLRKRKILRLVITCSAGRKGAALLENEIQVDFGGQAKGSTTRVVAIRVRSDAVGWPNRALSELEEQVERTWLRHFQFVLILCGLLVAALVVLFFQLPLSFGPGPLDVTRAMWLRDHDLDRVDQILSQGRPINDEEMRDITTRQLRNVLADLRPKQSPQTGRTGQILVIVIPLVVVVVLGFILLSTCYPTAVFLWGDEEERYASIVNRRKYLWGIIISVTFIGVLSKFFATGVSSWLPP